jgi:hypothetical protein
MGTVTPLFYEKERRRDLRVPVRQPISEQISQITAPIVQKLGQLSQRSNLTPGTAGHDVAADASIGLRCFSDGLNMLVPELRGVSLGGAPWAALTSVPYTVIGLSWAANSLNQKRYAERIHDTEGAFLATAEIGQNLSMSAGSLGLSGVRGFAIAQEIAAAIHHPLTLPAAAKIFQSCCSWAFAAFFTIYYAIYAWKICQMLRGLSKGDNLRRQLLSKDNPLAELEGHVQLDVYKSVSNTERKEAINIGIEEGALWLKKIAKEARKNNLPVHWDESEEALKTLSKEFLLKAVGEDNLVLFGLMIAEKKLYALKEAVLTRELGSDAIAAAKENNPVKFKEALEATSWTRWGPRVKAVIKLVLIATAAAAIIAGTIMSGGVALGVLTLLFGISGVIWIILDDGAALKDQIASGNVGKWDKFTVVAALVTSVIAISGLIAVSVLTGGLPLYIGSMILVTAWLLINCRSAYNLIKYQQKPWEYLKVPTVRAFSKLVETQPSADKIQETLVKMSEHNRTGLRREVDRTRNWVQAARDWEDRLQGQERRVLRGLVEALQPKQPIVRPAAESDLLTHSLLVS